MSILSQATAASRITHFETEKGEPMRQEDTETTETTETTEAGPATQVVEGKHIPSSLTAEDAADYEFIRDFVIGVPYAVEAVNAAKAG